MTSFCDSGSVSVQCFDLLTYASVNTLHFSRNFYGFVGGVIPKIGLGPVSYTHLTLPTNREV